jgi:hypothetical protein
MASWGKHRGAEETDAYAEAGRAGPGGNA